MLSCWPKRRACLVGVLPERVCSGGKSPKHCLSRVCISNDSGDFRLNTHSMWRDLDTTTVVSARVCRFCWQLALWLPVIGDDGAVRGRSWQNAHFLIMPWIKKAYERKGVDSLARYVDAAKIISRKEKSSYKRH